MAFIIERTVNAPVIQVWDAISKPDAMRKWYFDVSDFKPEPGFQFSFTGQGKDGKTIYIHHCEVKEVIPEKKLSYSWKYESYPGGSVVTFQLFPEGNQTRIVLTYEGLESFAINGPDFQPSNFEEGWTFIIGESLPKYLEAKV